MHGLPSEENLFIIKTNSLSEQPQGLICAKTA